MKDFAAIFLSFVATFGPNLMSKNPACACSMDYILKDTLMDGYARGSPAIVEPIAFLNQLANSSQTVAQSMSMYQEALLEQREEADDAKKGLLRFSITVADQPLYARRNQRRMDQGLRLLIELLHCSEGCTSLWLYRIL